MAQPQPKKSRDKSPLFQHRFPQERPLRFHQLRAGGGCVLEIIFPWLFRLGSEAELHPGRLRGGSAYLSRLFMRAKEPGIVHLNRNRGLQSPGILTIRLSCLYTFVLHVRVGKQHLASRSCSFSCTQSFSAVAWVPSSCELRANLGLVT